MACPSCEAEVSGAAMPLSWRNLQVVTSALSGLLLALGFFGSLLGLSPLLETSLYLLAVVIGGWYFIREGIETLLEERQIGIEILMAVAAGTGRSSSSGCGNCALGWFAGMVGRVADPRRYHHQSMPCCRRLHEVGCGYIAQG